MMNMMKVLVGFILLICMTFACQTLKVQETVEVPGAVGVYLVKMSTPGGEVELTLAIETDGTGYIESMMGKSDFSDAEINGNNFKIDTAMHSPMGEMAVTLIGSVDGDNISGSIGTQMGDIPFAGQRKLNNS